MSEAGKLLVFLVFGSLAAGGFAVLFNLPQRGLLAASLVGGTAVLVRGVALQLGAPAEVATFFGGLAVGALAEIGARQLQLPAPLFSVPGFIPLVPGVPAFRAVLNFARGSYTPGLEDLVRALLLTAAIAAGLGTVKALAALREKPLF